MSTPQLSIVIPCYNEARRLEPLFALIRAEAARPWEWLLVNDGSRDDTATRIAAFAAATTARVRLVSLPANRGKGAAVRAGLREAAGDLVGFVDCDLAASPLEFARFLDDAELRAGQCLLLGIRLLTQERRVKRLPHRHLMGRVFQTYTSLMTGLTVYDTQCGFKLMARGLARELATRLTIDGFAFDVEMILIAHLLGARIREEPIAWEEKGDSKVRPRHILQMLRDIARIRWRRGGYLRDPRG